MVIGFLAKLNSNRRNRIDFQKLREEHSGGRKGPILLCNTRTREIDKKKTGIFIIILGRALKEQIFFFWGVIVILQISVNLVPYLFIYLFTCVPMNLDEEESSKTKQNKKKKSHFV